MSKNTKRSWLWMLTAIAALSLNACGDDDGGASGTGGGTSGAGGTSGTGGTGGEQAGTGGNAGTGGDTDAGMPCQPGSQDNDGDGVCDAACSESTDCGHGACDDSTGRIECICEGNFVGTLCDTCTIGTTGDSCSECDTNFFLDAASPTGCREDFCASMQCPANSICNNTPTGAVCGCNIGWTGSNCDSCDEGYTGAGCVTCDTGYIEGPGQVFTCVPNVCGSVDCNFGTCFNDNGVGACNCDEGYGSADCSTCMTGWTLLPNAQCMLQPPATANMVVWLDASDESTIFTDANGGVTSWHDKHPGATMENNWAGPSGRRPTVSAGVARKRIVFNGIDDTLRTYVDLSNPSYDIFIVAKWNANKTAQGLLGGTGMSATAHGLWIQAVDADTVHYRHRYPFATGSGSELDGDGFDAATGLQLVHARRRAAPVGNHLAVGEGHATLSELSPLESMPFGEPLNTWLGCNGPSGNGPLDGEIAEVIIYGGLLSEANRQKVVEYLTAKWQL